jgi:hypothetical protein
MSRKQDSQRLLYFINTIHDELEFAFQNFPRLLPEWLADQELTDEWKATNRAFLYASHLLKEHRMPKRVYHSLEGHGLTGDLLESKISFIEKVSKRFHKFFNDHKRDLPMLRRPAARSLGVLDNYLDSLADVFFGFGAVKEIKEQFESALESPDELT